MSVGLPPPGDDPLGIRRRPRATESQQRSLRLHRHISWLIPLAVCVVFIVLIGGALTVPASRRVIVRFARGLAGQVDENPDPKSRQEKTDVRTREAKVSPPDSRKVVDNSEQDMETTTLPILPPSEAGAEGRTLPRMLLVGEGPTMFPSIEEALKIVVSGDVIEIRTNRPMVVANVNYKAKNEQTGDSLTICAGQGFRPVLRYVPVNPKPNGIMLRVRNTRIALRGLHFSYQYNRGGHFFHFDNGGGLTANKCTFTASADNGGGGRSIAEFRGPSPKDSTCYVRLQNCFLRGGYLGVVVTASASFGSIELHNCLQVGGGVLAYFPDQSHLLLSQLVAHRFMCRRISVYQDANVVTRRQRVSSHVTPQPPRRAAF